MGEDQRRDEELGRLADEQEQVEAAAMEAGSIGGIAPDGDPAMASVVEAGGGESEGQELSDQELVDRIEGQEIESVPDAHVEGEPDTFDEPT